MHLNIRHLTEYRYSTDAWDSYNELWLHPADDYRQTLLSFDLSVSPGTSLRSVLDYYGNTVHNFYLHEGHRVLRIEARSQVVTYATPEPIAVSARILSELRPRFFEYLAPTSRVPLDQDWLSVFAMYPLEPHFDLVLYLKNMTAHFHQHFSYRAGSTQVNTPLTDFAQAKAGVCQDYAHAMLALCRSLGIPVRYVSGYLHTGLGVEGSHAWLEAFLPGNGWVGFDPTNGCLVGEGYVKIGYGRDYDDVPPTKGLRRGGGESGLTVEVSVETFEPELKETPALQP